MTTFHVVVAAMFLAIAGSVDVRRQATSQRACSDLISAGHRFDFHNGHTSVCAAAKIPDSTGARQCFVGSQSFLSAQQRCEAMGARLCTYDELRTDVATGSGCQTGQPSSYCWVSDSDGLCEDDQAYVTRCKSINQPSKTCVDRSFAGTIVCCADGSAARIVEEDNDRCAAATCGVSCASISGCGWSSERNKCVEGGTTSAAEMLAGECSEADLRQGCARHVCGADCGDDANCMWSKSRDMCVEGTGKTSDKERLLGDCPPANPGDAIGEPRKECKNIACAKDCTGACGWNQKRNMCVLGGHTTKHEIKLGMCNDGVVLPAENTGSREDDPCKRHVCGANCAADTANKCGWRSHDDTCHRGAKTSKRELARGLCVNVEIKNRHCKQFKCGAECKTQEGCGWSSSRMKCLAGKLTSNKELEMCSEDSREGTEDTTSSDPPSDPSTDPPTDPPSNPQTNPPTTSPTDPPTDPPTNPPTDPPTDPPTPQSTQTACADTAGWVDSDGEGCGAYASKNYCEADGSYGVGWDPSQTFATYAVNGVSAASACCACGGGSGDTSTNGDSSDGPTRSSKSCAQLGFRDTNSVTMTNVCGSSHGANGECMTFDNGDATWEEAKEACDALGARMCTTAELQANVPQGTGCRIDKYLVWSGDSCPGGGYYAGNGRNPFLGPASLVAGCRPSSSGAAIRCCADKF